jgi:hypothetical protein
MKTDHLSNREKADLMSQAKTHGEMLRIIGLTTVGYWFQKKPERPAWDVRPIPPDPDGLLWPGDVIDLTWDASERAKVVKYLKAGKVFMGWMGYSWCRLCAETEPPRDPSENQLRDWECLGSTDRFDGKFVWPEGYAHYVETTA